MFISDKLYWRQIDLIILDTIKMMESKELFLVDGNQFAMYLNKKQNLRKKKEGIYPFVLKDSNKDIINQMIKKNLLIYLETTKLLILKEKLKCIKCGESLFIEDTIDNIIIKCNSCNQDYELASNKDIGYWKQGDLVDEFNVTLHFKDLKEVIR